jgi:hypothetical protein
MQKAGVGLLLVAYALLIYIAVASPAYAHAHESLGAAFLAPYAAPWPLTLLLVVAGVGIILALIPIRRGERWAIWTSAAMLLAMFAVRFATDPRCLVVLDPHQHGCHTFMIGIVAGLLGLALASRRRVGR